MTEASLELNDLLSRTLQLSLSNSIRLSYTQFVAEADFTINQLKRLSGASS